MLLVAFTSCNSINRNDKENNWLLIESNLKWIEKDYSKTEQWFNKNLKEGSYRQDIFTPDCYSLCFFTQS